MTQLGGLPVNAGKGVFHGVAGIAGVFKRGGDKDTDDIPPDLPTGQASQPTGVSDTTQAIASFPSSDEHDGAAASYEPGTLRVTILDAEDLPHQDVKPYATVRIGDKEFKTKHTGKTNRPEWRVLFCFLDLGICISNLPPFFIGMNHSCLPLLQ